MNLILKVKDSLEQQFPNGIKFRPDRLANIDEAIVIRNNEIIAAYRVDNQNIVYDAQNNTIKLDSILKDQLDYPLTYHRVNYKTFNPATIKSINDILV